MNDWRILWWFHLRPLGNGGRCLNLTYHPLLPPPQLPPSLRARLLPTASLCRCCGPRTCPRVGAGAPLPPPCPARPRCQGQAPLHHPNPQTLPLPTGTRKEVRVEGKSLLLFWYRNQIYAIEGR